VNVQIIKVGRKSVNQEGRSENKSVLVDVEFKGKALNKNRQMRRNKHL
jgi:hypothetical protein